MMPFGYHTRLPRWGSRAYECCATFPGERGLVRTGDDVEGQLQSPQSPKVPSSQGDYYIQVDAPADGRCHLLAPRRLLDERVAYFEEVRRLERDFTDKRVRRLGANALSRAEFEERLLAELGPIDLDTYSRHMHSFHRQFPQFRSNSKRKRRHPRSGGARASTAEAAAAGCITRFTPAGASASRGILEHPWTYATTLGVARERPADGIEHQLGHS